MTWSRISGCFPSASSRRRISEASLPSISPAWMPFWISTIGLSTLRALRPVKAFSRETTTNGSARPSPEEP